MWNLLFILKSKGLTKSKEKCVRITVPARPAVIVLPFAKLKLAVLTTEELLQADLCCGEVSLTALLPLPASAQLGRTAGRVSDLLQTLMCCHPAHGSARSSCKAEEGAASSVHGEEKAGGQKVESGIYHNVT